MSDERIRILKMVENGKINIDEASQLLETLDTIPKKETKKQARFLKIYVEKSGEEKVNISIPLSLAKSVLKYLPQKVKDNLNDREINLELLMKSIEGDLDKPFTLVNINDDDDRVVIKLE